MIENNYLGFNLPKYYRNIYGDMCTSEFVFTEHDYQLPQNSLENHVLENYIPKQFNEKSDLFEYVSNIQRTFITLNEKLHVAIFLEDLANDILNFSFNLIQKKEIGKYIRFNSLSLQELKKSNENHKWNNNDLNFDLYVNVTNQIEHTASSNKIDTKKEEYAIYINYNYIKHKRNILSDIVHELIHIIDMVNSHSVIPYSVGVIGDSYMDEFIYSLMYAFSPKEINARLSEIYYIFKDKSFDVNEKKKLIEELKKESQKYINRSIEATFSPVEKIRTNDSYFEKYFESIALYDKMLLILNELEKFEDKDKETFIKKIIESSKNYEKVLNDYDLNDNIKLSRKFFGISEKTSYKKGYKNVLIKCKYIFKNYSYKINKILRNLENSYEIDKSFI